MHPSYNRRLFARIDRFDSLSIQHLCNTVFADSSVVSKVVNSFFESVSGFSTTGLNMITNVDALPRSIVFYRGLTQWVGGISIVFIFVAFFYSEKVLDNLSRAIGAEKSTTKSVRFKRVCVSNGIKARVAVCIGLARAKWFRPWLVIPVIHGWGEVEGKRIETSRPLGSSGLSGIIPVNVRSLFIIWF